MPSIKRFKAPEINLNIKSNYSSNSANSSINSTVKGFDNEITISDNNVENTRIENVDLSLNENHKGHSLTSFSDQEDILINGICSKITNDINNKFNDNENKDESLPKLYPIFSTIVNGKKISDIVDEEGRIKDMTSIMSKEEITQLAKDLEISEAELEEILKNIDNLLSEENNKKLQIVDYPDKMSSDIMGCKINSIVSDSSGFDAVVLEEPNGNLMPIISGTNTGQTVDLLADLYPIIANDDNMLEIINKIDEILKYDLYEDKLQILIKLKAENYDAYCALVHILQKVITENPDFLTQFSEVLDINKLNWIDDYGGDRDGIVYWLVELLGNSPELLTALSVASRLFNPNASLLSEIVIEKLLSLANIDTTLLGKFCELLGLDGKTMLAIKEEGLLNYMKSCYDTQRNKAQDLVYKTIEEAKEKGTKVDINGYSLGGGLALTSYANICLDDPSMEQYINSVTAYDPAIIHTEREENGDKLIDYISNSDKTKLFIVSGDLTATYNKTLKTDKLDKQIFFIEPKEEISNLSIGTTDENEKDGEIYIENSFTDNDNFNNELSKILKNSGLNLSDDGLNYIAKELDIIREQYLYKENDQEWNQSINFILNKVIFKMDSVESYFFGETHYMNSIDYERDLDESGNFIKEYKKENFEQAHGAADQEQNEAQSVTSTLAGFTENNPEDNNDQ